MSQTPSPSATPTIGDPGSGEELEGTLTLAPTFGPAGSTFTVSSKTACVDADGKVGPAAAIFVVSSAGVEDGAVLDASFPTDAKGNWTTSVKVPATAEDGDQLMAIAACFDSAEVTEDSEPFLVYTPDIFTVTAGAAAPPVKPVPGEPSFTG